MNVLRLEEIVNSSSCVSEEEVKEMARFILDLQNQKPCMSVEVIRSSTNKDFMMTSTEHLVEFDVGIHKLFKIPTLPSSLQ